LRLRLPLRNSLTGLVRAAALGDQDAWETIVDRFSGLVWATARAHRLSRTDAADVSQTTWLRLVENLDRIRRGAELRGDRRSAYPSAASARRGCAASSG
jgi:transposase InsO family protein